MQSLDRPERAGEKRVQCLTKPHAPLGLVRACWYPTSKGPGSVQTAPSSLLCAPALKATTVMTDRGCSDAGLPGAQSIAGGRAYISTPYRPTSRGGRCSRLGDRCAPPRPRGESGTGHSVVLPAAFPRRLGCGRTPALLHTRRTKGRPVVRVTCRAARVAHLPQEAGRFAHVERARDRA
jgi:hypothetical protein